MNARIDGLNRSPRVEHLSYPQPTSATLDESYWQAVLQDGEMAPLSGPPPWIQQPSRYDEAVADDDGSGSVEADWQRAMQLFEAREGCELAVTACNRGGLLVKFGRLVGFVPSSHLIGFPTYTDPYRREQALDHRVGSRGRFIIIEIDRERNRLILSERAALDTRNNDQLLARLKPGDLVTGRVTNLRRFGAFVDLGGFEGLVHISEMSWGRVNHPGDVVQLGQEVWVYVLDVNREERKVQLSIKRLLADPWQAIEERYSVGQVIRGQVTNVVSFGAFVRVAEGVEGLIHISELAECNFLHPRNVVREGEWVDARVLNIDPVNRRIGLSLRHVNHGPSHGNDGSQRAIAPKETTGRTVVW